MGVVLQNLRSSLAVFDTFQGQIDGFFEYIYAELAGLQAEYQSQLQDMREKTASVVEAAIGEVCEHAHDSAYSSSPVVKAILDRVRMGAIGTVNLLDMRVNEVTRDTLKTVFGLQFDFLMLDFSHSQEIGGNIHRKWIQLWRSRRKCCMYQRLSFPRQRAVLN